MEFAIAIVLILAAVFLIVAVLLQSGKSHNLSGAIAGGAETFFGKEKGASADKKLPKITAIVAIVFVVLVLVSYLLQDADNKKGTYDPNWDPDAEASDTSDTDDGSDTGDGETGESGESGEGGESGESGESGETGESGESGEGGESGDEGADA